jgi:hypothetical protein
MLRDGVFILKSGLLVFSLCHAENLFEALVHVVIVPWILRVPLVWRVVDGPLIEKTVH